MFERPDKVDDKLYLMTCIFNATRDRYRWYLYEQFVQYIERFPNVKLYTIEIAFGDRAFSVTESNNSRHIQQRTNHMIWLKENGLNVLLQHLPKEANYIGWVDADGIFTDPLWAENTIQALQHHKWVQMWSHGLFLNEKHCPTNNERGESIFTSFGYCHWLERQFKFKNTLLPKGYNDYYKEAGSDPELQLDLSKQNWHCGFAWAAKRETLRNLGGLLDISPVGAGDWFMANACRGKFSGMKANELTMGKTGFDALVRWEQRALKYINYDIGFVPGTFIHYYHGDQKKRRYIQRGDVCKEANFEYLEHLYKDEQGLYQIVDDNVALRDGIRSYFVQRDDPFYL
jgi:hypothetical protein